MSAVGGLALPHHQPLSFPPDPESKATQSFERVYDPSWFFSIKWRKDGRDYLTLPGKSSTTEIRELDKVTSKLKISNSEQDDAGRYSCEASNAFGNSHFSIDVTIWGKSLNEEKEN